MESRIQRVTADAQGEEALRARIERLERDLSEMRQRSGWESARALSLVHGRGPPSLSPLPAAVRQCQQQNGFSSSANPTPLGPTLEQHHQPAPPPSSQAGSSPPRPQRQHRRRETAVETRGLALWKSLKLLAPTLAYFVVGKIALPLHLSRSDPRSRLRSP